MGGRLTGQLERRDGLAELADMTGGRAVINTNAPEARVPEVFAESHSYYSLGFPPADPTRNGRFHKIEVKVDRRGVSVHTRAGYYAGETRAAGSKPTVVSPDASAAMEGSSRTRDVPLRVNVAPFALPGKPESAVAIVLNVQQRPSTGQNQPVKVLTAAFDRNGRSVASEEQTVAVVSHSPAGGKRPTRSCRASSRTRWIRDPGGPRRGPDQRASVYTYVDVPDFARQPLSLSGSFLRYRLQWAPRRLTRSGTSRPSFQPHDETLRAQTTRLCFCAYIRMPKRPHSLPPSRRALPTPPIA